MHNQLAGDYRGPDGYPYDCAIVALWVAKKLRDDGKDPHIIGYVDGSESNISQLKALEPTPFEGRVQWFGHIVCINEGLVYDPILEEPEPADSYCTKVFGREIQPRDEDHLLTQIKTK